MAVTPEYLQLRLVPNAGITPDDYLSVEVSIVVQAFTGCGMVSIGRNDLAAFGEQLNTLIDRASGSASLNCAVVSDRGGTTYFGCEIEPLTGRSLFAAHLALGTAGTEETLHRLHVELLVRSDALAKYRVGLQQLLSSEANLATLRNDVLLGQAAGVSQPLEDGRLDVRPD